MKKKRGRPPTLTMPDPISDTPENVVQALLTTPGAIAQGPTPTLSAIY